MIDAMLAFEWGTLDTQIVVVGALSAISCALLGVFLVLRRMSMMGDAISHAVLPGLAVAFLVTESRADLPMFLGAAVVGVLTAVLVQWIHERGGVEQGASMGVVFTILFALGLVLIRQAADHVDLDPDCVLYGAIEFVPLDALRVSLGGLVLAVPRAAIPISAVLLVNLAVVGLMYKELKITTFDPALATTLGINARFMHYLLMTLVAVTTVSAFETVGSILVIAMLIVPPATAHLLTDRLSLMLVLSAALAAASAGLGHVGAMIVPGWLGFGRISTSTAGMMAAAAGAMFGVAVLAAPRHGIVSRALHRLALAVQIAAEDVLGVLYRLEESPGRVWSPAQMRRAIAAGPVVGRLALWRLRRTGRVSTAGGECRLTDAGRAAARSVVRSHRLWESYLSQHMPLAADHLHVPAETLEHVTTAPMQERLAASLGEPELDPQGKPIPGRRDE